MTTSVWFFGSSVLTLALAHVLTRTGQAQVAATVTMLHITALVYYGSWLGHKDHLNRGWNAAVPPWLRVLIRQPGPKAGIHLTLLQVGAIGAAAGVLVGFMRRIPEHLQWLWGLSAGLCTATAFGLSWWVWRYGNKE